ncbi:Eukaryotic translation initiation factor 6 [Mucor velutinosus]|uniref:Eukaryotic translation initiation factor 6 n=1 Tax=Mucor velutinosus TaxID=708070 RepID=A0AAN7DLI1_9FUNG|nr:Eukaryotic translation initiation factor 6 [Mucor velutinosus]
MLSFFTLLQLYNRDDNKLIQWGRSAKAGKSKYPNITILQQFKLYLDDNLEGVVRQLPLDLTATDIIADYLEKFFAYVKVDMTKKGFHQNFEKQARFCLTVPAMWSDKSKQIMRDAAIQSGIINASDHRDRLMLISEPEAAALYCERTCDKFNMQHGDEFMICDAGGGTVDLIVFRVEMDAAGNRKFRESTKGLGKSCGSTFIDRNFRKHLRKKLKKVIRRSPNGAIEIPDAPLDHMMDIFVDNLKPLFDGTDDLYSDISMGFDLVTKTEPSIGLDEGNMTFTKEELKKHVFDPVISEVVQLCRDLQKDTTNLKAIFMVGGFGSSAYLYSQMEKEFLPENIRIVQPDRPEMAVARGAVIFGMHPSKIATRIPRFWYGIEITNIFDPEIDPIEYKVVRPDRSVRCDNRFSTYVERGKPLDIDSCVSRNYTTYYPSHTACTFFASDSDTEPRYTISTPTTSVRKVFDFEIPMPVLPNVKHGDPVPLTIKMYFGEVELRVEAVIDDQTYAVVCNFNA